jgi:putative spermidine/putrescine transport system permease protein
MTSSGVARILLRLATAAVLTFLYLPLVIIAIYAFNESRIQAWPPTGLTLHWFDEAIADPRVIQALINSIIVATIATAIALVLGTLASLAVQRYDFFGRQTISFFLVLPIALPGVVTGIALRTSFVTFGVEFGLLTIVIGHATFCVVIAYNNVIARLRRLPQSWIEASMDLGADGWQTFKYVTFPALRTALVAGGLLAFALSFDEIVVTNFTAGSTLTIPKFIYNNVRLPRNRPVVNVVAVAVILVMFIPVYIAQRMAGGPSETARGRAVAEP